MLVANSFDLWQKDPFFSAAEEVQQSADLMDSAYRVWSRARNEGSVPENLEQLSGEFQIALGTAKWQLEEFEKTVFLSYKSHQNDVTIRRHKDFISAMGHQISHVESKLIDHFVEEKKPFRWVNLDEDERDELAHFISGVSSNPRGENMISQTVVTVFPDQETNLEEVPSSSEGKNCLTDRVESRSSDRIIHSTHRTRGSYYEDMLEIVIDRNERLTDSSTDEATPKDKASKNRSRLSRIDEDSNNYMYLSWMNPCLGIHQVYHRLVSPVKAVKSIRNIFILMLTILLVVPFLMYSA